MCALQSLALDPRALKPGIPIWYREHFGSRSKWPGFVRMAPYQNDQGVWVVDIDIADENFFKLYRHSNQPHAALNCISLRT